MTIRQIISTYSKRLGSSSPVLDVELILTFLLNKDKEYLYSYADKKLTTKQKKKFKALFTRRQKGEPIAYILGKKEFYGLDFKINKNVLIPRPETELLIEEVIAYHKALSQKLKAQCQIADIGVGSGAIIISLAKNIKKAKFYCTDISDKALQIAQQNAKSHKVKIKFLKGNLLAPLNPKLKTLSSKLIITANLPYLDQKEKNLLPSSDTRGLKFEPKIAWDGGPDGLKYYREFFNQIKNLQLQPQAIFLEIGHNQAKAIRKLAKQVLPDYKFKVKKDLCVFDRIVIIKK